MKIYLSENDAIALASGRVTENSASIARAALQTFQAPQHYPTDAFCNVFVAQALCKFATRETELGHPRSDKSRNGQIGFHRKTLLVWLDQARVCGARFRILRTRKDAEKAPGAPPIRLANSNWLILRRILLSVSREYTLASEQQMWGIHGGRTGDANTLFLQENCIALGWHKVGDLSKLVANREAFKAEVASKFPEKKAGAIPVDAGQLFRFIHEAKIGDIVIYPSKANRHIYIGRIKGNYSYRIKGEVTYPHRRPVEWLKDVPRTQFSQGALHEVGSAMSFFAVKSYADEFRAVIEGKIQSTPVAEDETVAAVAEEIEEQTRDYILKKLAQELKGGSFEDFVAQLLQVMGYKTRQPKRGKGSDGGVDIIAHKDELGFEPPIIKVQVKSKEGTSGDPEVSALYGKCDKGEYALFVTLGDFSNQADNFARNKPNLRLISGDELVNLILHHYEKFDSRYKGLLPLKRVYVPDPEDKE